MANTIFTRIQLKYDSYAGFEAVKDTFKPLKGELCIVNPGTNLSDAATVPCLMKVGDGEHFWKDLTWVSATAADVYAWAKAANVVFENQHILFKDAAGGTVKDLDLSDFVTDGELTAKLTGYYTKEEINGLFGNVVNTVTTVTEGTGITVTDNGSDGNHAYTVELDVEGTKTALGLKNAAYETVENLNATAKGYADAVEAKLPTSADYGVLTITGKDAVKVTEGQNPEVSLALDASGNVVLSQSETGLKAVIDLSAYRLITDDQDTTYGLAYDSENKVIKLVAGGTDLEIPASDFVADGMLQSVVADKENNTLTFTWNTDGGATITTVNLTDIADIYTGKAGTTVTVAVSNTNEISAEVNAKSITSAHLADDLVTAINKDDNTTYTFAKTANKFEFTVTPSEGDAQTVTLNAGALAGKDKIAESDIEGTIAHTKINGLGALATKDGLTATDVGAATAGDITAAIEALDSSVEATEGSVLTGVTITDGKLTAKTEKALHEIATSGSIYDITEGANVSTGTDAVEYLIFNCGTASTVI